MTSAATSDVSDDCGAVGRGFERISVPAGPTLRLTGAIAGNGRTGIVFTHQSDGDLCGWLPYARTLIGHYRVLAIDLDGYGTSPVRSNDDTDGFGADVAAGAAELRRRGADRVILVGASIGAAASLAAAGRPGVTGDAVAALSPPESLQGEDVVAATRRIRIPVLLLAADDDASFANQTRTLYRSATRARPRRLVIFPAGGHGWSLVAPSSPARRDADALLRAFFARTASGP